MTILASENLAIANTTVITAVNSVFENGPPGVYKTMTMVTPASGTSIEIVVVDGVGQVREWIGPKQYQNFRAYRKNVVLRKWEYTFELDRVLVDQDQSGAVGQRINTLKNRLEQTYDKIIIDAFLANSITGYDGSALLADAHANVNGTTYDNLTTAALSHAEFKTGMQVLELSTDEAGSPLGFYGRKLLVGPAQRRVGMEVTGSTRLVSISSSGTENATSSVVATGAYENYLGGSVELIVSPRITGNQWLLFDDSKPGCMPYILAEFQKPYIVSQTDLDAPARFENDVYRWSLEAYLSPVPGAWQTSYGSVTA